MFCRPCPSPPDVRVQKLGKARQALDCLGLPWTLLPAYPVRGPEPSGPGMESGGHQCLSNWVSLETLRVAHRLLSPCSEPEVPQRICPGEGGWLCMIVVFLQTLSAPIPNPWEGLSLPNPLASSAVVPGYLNPPASSCPSHTVSRSVITPPESWFSNSTSWLGQIRLPLWYAGGTRRHFQDVVE